MSTTPEHTHDTATDGQRVIVEETVPDHRAAVAAQKQEYGGIQWGAAFFGFLAALGVGVLLTALASAAGAAVGLATNTSLSDAANNAVASNSVDTVGLVSGIVLLVVLFVAYYSGGYVAGRMARFSGARQGFAVWLWALVIAAAVAVLAAVAGNKYDVLGQLNSFPRLPVNQGDVTRGGAIVAVIVVVVSLVAAVLGGLGGMRFHRRVDRTV